MKLCENQEFIDGLLQKNGDRYGEQLVKDYLKEEMSDG